MLHLYTYLYAILSIPSPVIVVNKTEKFDRFSDGDNIIEECEIIYTFNNGVKVLYEMESDSFQSDNVCYECWISYEVIHDNGYVISPKKKMFYNSCQEKFWLKMQNGND